MRMVVHALPSCISLMRTRSYSSYPGQTDPRMNESGGGASAAMTDRRRCSVWQQAQRRQAKSREAGGLEEGRCGTSRRRDALSSHEATPGGLISSRELCAPFRLSYALLWR